MHVQYATLGGLYEVCSCWPARVGQHDVRKVARITSELRIASPSNGPRSIQGKTSGYMLCLNPSRSIEDLRATLTPRPARRLARAAALESQHVLVTQPAQPSPLLPFFRDVVVWVGLERVHRHLRLATRSCEVFGTERHGGQ